MFMTHLKPIASAAVLAVGVIIVSAFPSHAMTNKAESTEVMASNQLGVINDDRFMALRSAAFRVDSNAAKTYANQLTDFDIPSYVDYYVLRTQLHKASNEQMLGFINQYYGSAIADRLRNDWLLILANRGDWSNFDQQLPLYVVNDDMQVKCYALLSKAIKKQKVVNDMNELITSSKHFGDGCYKLIEYLYDHRQIQTSDVWKLMRYATESSATAVVKRLGKVIDVSEKRLLEAFDKPIRVINKSVSKDETSKELFLMALGRHARVDPEQSAAALKRNASVLSKKEKAQGWANIALPASHKLHTSTLSYWSDADGAFFSEDSYQWRARIALREGDWPMLKSAILDMPPLLKNNETWTFWLARILRDEGKKEEANKLFSKIAGQHHFYGQLALEELGQKIGVPVVAKPVTAQELVPISKNTDLLRAIRFYEMGLRFEGTREWNWALRNLSEREHIVAAEFARQNNLLDRMVNTSDRTKIELDFNQRFPTPFNDKMQKATNLLGLDMAWVYGLIRQESRFIQHAKSHVGASGLMQIMPKTARWVAKKIGLSTFVPEQVNEIETNIQLGTNYLNMVLTDLGNSQALASAAYNAGPSRPRSWRSTLNRPVEGAIFAETIPFTETRDYVKNVLSNATYYAALIEKKPQSLKTRLGTVVPRGMATDNPDLP